MSVAPEVLAAWGWADATTERLTGGLINETHRVDVDGAPVAVVQRLHPVFAPEVNLDVEAVTAHLAARGLPTPRLVRTIAGGAWWSEGGTWRALTWVDGVTVATATEPAWAEAAGELVGRFHRAVDDLAHAYASSRPGAHDTPAHLARLAAACAAAPRDDLDRAAQALGAELASAAGALPALPPLPPRHIHGDLKLSNLRFAAEAAPRGVCLLDLDTVGRGLLAHELGDALRSWCNPRGEDHEDVHFELALFEAAMRGYQGAAGRLDEASAAAVVAGVEIIALELAARFALDAIEDRYFGWDPTRYPSRRAHCLVRARGQAALARSVRAQRDAARAALAAR